MNSIGKNCGKITAPNKKQNPSVAINIDMELPLPYRDPFLPPSEYLENNEEYRKHLGKGSAVQQTTFVYMKDDKVGWIPAELIKSEDNHGVVIPRPSPRAKPLADNNFANRMRVGNIDFDKYNDNEDDNYENARHEKIKQKLEVNTTTNDDIPSTQIILSEYENRSLPLQDVDSEGKLITREDMCDIPYLHEASILYNLKERFEGEFGVPYTRAGDIIVSINPYRWIKGLYSEKNRHLYAVNLVWKGYSRKAQYLPPHVYETSAKAFKGLTHDGQNQSILVSGESGAGKTVAVKILMTHLATFEDTKYKNMDPSLKFLDDDKNESNFIENIADWMKHRLHKFVYGYRSIKSEAPAELDDEPEEMQQNNDIVQRVLDSNPLLEAFGNAKTFRNDNSSRFSKYIELQFHVQQSRYTSSSASLAGSKCRTYLLEKSRVISHDNVRGDRTFHIFYQLLAASDKFKEQVWEGLVGSSPKSFLFVGETKTSIIEGLTDAQRFKRTLATLDTIGVDKDEMIVLMRALCIVLQLGNLVFEEDPTDDMASYISSKEELAKLSDIFGIGFEEIEILFTKGKITVRAEEIEVKQSATSAKNLCNALAKELYSMMFEWLVRTINNATCAENNYKAEKSVNEFGIIGLLDIFGFEINDVNRFEQLCINHTNEKLQQKFTQDIFRSVRDEYDSEGINLSEVKFEDNSNVLNLMEGKLGLIDILNEECLRVNGTDICFVNKLYGNNKNSTSLINSKRYNRYQFGIAHYAGNVTYDGTQFVEKNKDTLPKYVAECVLQCTNDLIRTELQNRRAGMKKRNRALIGRTVWTKFRNQLTDLMTEIGKTKTWYVRCINPNKKKYAGVMDLRYAITQLRCAGVVSSITIARSAFPNRLKFQKVLDRFSVLVKPQIRKKMKLGSRSYSLSKLGNGSYTLSKDTQKVLDFLLKNMEHVSQSGGVSKAFVCGKSRLYFRPGALEHLESERLNLFEASAVVIQSFVRRKMAIDQYGFHQGGNDDYTSVCCSLFFGKSFHC